MVAAYFVGVPTPPGQSVLQLRIALDEVDPAVWRRLLVPASVRLAKLHDIFQVAMGWTNSHGEHDHIMKWVGGSFDPAFFGLVDINVALQHVR